MGPVMLRFIVGAFLIRFLTNEQSYGMISMMRAIDVSARKVEPFFTRS